MKRKMLKYKNEREIEMEQKLNKKNGITLIALVITIIVLCVVIRSHINVIVNNYLDWVKWSIFFSLIIILVIAVNSLVFDFKTIKELIEIFRKRKL